VSGALDRLVDDRAVVDFLYHETHLLNEERYAEWLELLSDRFDYRMPNPQLHDDPRIRPYSARSLLAWESVHSLRLRFERIASEYAWADRPPAFHRRHLTAVRVRPGAGEHEWEVSCDELVARSRTPEGSQVVSALREDLVCLEDGQLRLARRTVYLDLDRPDLAQIALLF
jgi:3-phenylpropionate/cinnamic acid dioxygenase small subunit